MMVAAGCCGRVFLQELRMGWWRIVHPILDPIGNAFALATWPYLEAGV
jgi:hypothetical protein